MNEIKKPQKPMLYYYGLVMLIIMLFNLFAIPAISDTSIVRTRRSDNLLIFILQSFLSVHPSTK